MPRRRHEEERSSSYSSSLRAERSSSSSRSSARSAPSPRSAAASSPSPRTERSTPRTSSYSQPPKQTVYNDYSSSESSSDEGMSFGFMDSIKDAIRSRTASKADPMATEVASSPSLPTEKSTPRTASYSPPPDETDYFSSTRSRSREVTSGIIDAILDVLLPSRTASKADPVAAPTPTEVANSTGSISCVTQAKTFQECLDEFETDISKCQSYMDIWCKCKKSSKF